MRQKRWWELGCSLHQLPARHLVKHRLRTVVSRISHWRLGLRQEELDRSKIQVGSLSSKFQISAHHIGKMGGTIMTVWSWSPWKRNKLKFRKQLNHFKCSNTLWWFEWECSPQVQNTWSPISGTAARRFWNYWGMGPWWSILMSLGAAF